MSLQTILLEIERLKLEFDSYYPIPIDRLQKINYKFRLEWNYHSNFTPEEETVQAVNSLTNWLDNELTAIKKKKSKRTVPEIAFEYHLRFLTIHPFLDGNGRTGRILMNLILIAHGYPPVVIRTEEKELYGKYIAHAQQYEENPMPLYEMLGNVLIRSFEICIKGAKGESIFEMEEWEKRLQILEHKMLDDNIELVKSHDTVYLTLINSIIPFLEYADLKFSSLNKLFSSNSKTVTISAENNSYSVKDTDLKLTAKDLGLTPQLSKNNITKSFHKKIYLIS